MDIFIELDPQKALFRGVWDLVLVPSKGKPALGETPGYLGGRLRTHTGHGTSQFFGSKCNGARQNAKNGPNICIVWQI